MKKKKLKERIKKEWMNIVFNLIFISANLFIVILFYDKIIIASIFLGLMAVTGLIRWKSWITIIIFFMSAILGFVIEIIAIKFDVWIYSYSNFLGAPLWLLLAWGNTGVFIYQTAIELKNLGVKK